MTAQPFLPEAPDAPGADPATPGSPGAVDLYEPAVLPLEGPASPAPEAGAVRHANRRGRLTGGYHRLRSTVVHRTDAVLNTILIAFVGLVHSVGLFSFPSLADDEGTYVAQASAIRSGELAHYTYWYDHPPLGWIQLALLDWLPQTLLPAVQPVAASRVVLVLAACVSAWLALVLASRLGMSRLFAGVAVLLAFASPLAVTMQRQVYLDNIATPWVLAAFVLVLDRKQRLWSYVAAGMAFAAAVGTKETTVVLVPVLLWAILRGGHPRTRTFSVAGFTGALAVIGYYPLMALLRGELLPGEGHVSLWDAVIFQLLHRPGSGAMWEAGSPSNAVLQSWLYYDAWIFGLGLIGIPASLAVRRLRPLGLALLVLLLVALKPGGYLPAMYIIVALPLMGLAAAGTAEVAWTGARRLAARWGGVRGRGLRLSVRVLAAASAVLLVLQWSPALAVAMTERTNGARVAAEQWMAANLPVGSTVLTDNVTWVALVQDGVVARERAIWFYKLDTDPAVRKDLPNGWRDVDYLVVTDQMRLSLAGDTTLVQSSTALRNSQVVASFGTGESAVEIRQVVPSGAVTTTGTEATR